MVEPAERRPVALVVEDEPRIASVMRKALQVAGLDVESVESGEDALIRVDRGGLNVLVLDLGLPGMDGLDVLRLLDERGRPVPVIVVTARTDPRDAEEARRLGAVAYLTKPFAVSALQAAAVAACGLTTG
jgi:DNA-binding response OmpR family regulator